MGVNKKHIKLINQPIGNPDNTLLIIGTALDGPSFQAFMLKDGYSARDILGESPLSDAHDVAKKIGVDNVILYRINGSSSSCSLADAQGQEVMAFTSISAAERYNELKIEIHNTHLVAYDVNGLARKYSYVDFPTSYDIAKAINLDADFGFLDFRVTLSQFDIFMSELATNEQALFFNSGSAEDHLVQVRQTSNVPHPYKDELLIRMKDALFGYEQEARENHTPNGALSAFEYAGITTSDLFLEDDMEIANVFGGFCMNKARHMGAQSIATIGALPTLSKTDSIEQLFTLAEARTSSDELGYVQVVVGGGYCEEVKNSVSLAIAYAARQTQLPYHASTTNKSLHPINQLTCQLSQENIDSLSSNGYICIVPSIRRGYVPHLAKTFISDQSSSLAKPHHIRITQHVSNRLYDYLDRFIGRNVSKHISKEKIKSESNRILEKIVSDGAIKDFSIRYEFLNLNRELSVVVTITLFSEVESITSVTNISLVEGVI